MASGLAGSNRDGKRPIDEASIDWDDDVGDVKEKNRLTLVGKIWASRSINVKAAIDTMIKLWNPSKPMMGNAVDAKEKTFVFRFGSEWDKAKVLEGQPWHFDKFLWCFNEPNQFGFKEGQIGCCGSGDYHGDFTCQKKGKSFSVCSNPNDHLWFDAAHPTDMANQQFSRDFWSGSSDVVSPINLQTLFAL